MSPRRIKLTAAAAAWLAMAVFAAAGPAITADTPTGDVWITHDAPGPLPSQAAQNAPLRQPLPTGDFWPAEDGVTRTGDAPAPPKDALVQEEAAASGMK